MTTVAMPVEVPVVRPDDLGCGQELPCMAEAVKPARLLVSAALRAWSADHLGDVAKLLVTELVANAVRHTRCTRIAVSVNRHPASVWVGVRDSSNALPCLMTAGDEAESGRGLELVDALSSRWGTAWVPCGKWVWFELSREKSSP